MLQTDYESLTDSMGFVTDNETKWQTNINGLRPALIDLALALDNPLDYSGLAWKTDEDLLNRTNEILRVGTPENENLGAERRPSVRR